MAVTNMLAMELEDVTGLELANIYDDWYSVPYLELLLPFEDLPDFP
jgi:hypothetical protein